MIGILGAGGGFGLPFSGRGGRDVGGQKERARPRAAPCSLC